MTSRELVRTVIMSEDDVFAVRHRGREVAAAVGMEGQDQVRVATALSEVGRQLLALGETTIVFRFASETATMLVMEASSPLPAGEFESLAAELAPARRLMDRWNVTVAGDRLVVTMARKLPLAASRLTAADLERLAEDLTIHTPTTPLQELAVQNRNLMTTLEQIQAHRDELLRVNAELEETNRGVVALYSQLSDEMEATNRGVVALYAELDEKSAQLREVSEAKSRFLANVSHELRAPATAIIGLLRLLLDARSEPLTTEQRHQIELIRGSANDLLSLVNGLLDLAKAESGRIDPQWGAIDLAEIFQTLRGTMQVLVTKPGLALVVDEPPPLPGLVSDDMLLSQILRNLLTNAIKFTEEGEVRLSAVAVDDAVELVVADTGQGIPEAERERVFEEFYQVRSPAHAANKGTGLGLPYARRLAELLGGSLTLSDNVGAGSVFTVRLPAHGPTGAEPVRLSHHVLVVEDDPAFRTAVVAVLEANGAEVTSAADGRAALEALATTTPDLVVLDLRLPEVDGTTVLDHLASDERLRNIPVMVLTAFSQDVANTTALPRATAVLGKADTALDDLPSAINAVLRRSRR